MSRLCIMIDIYKGNNNHVMKLHGRVPKQKLQNLVENAIELPKQRVLLFKEIGLLFK